MLADADVVSDDVTVLDTCLLYTSHPPQKNAETWNGLTDDTMTENTTDTRLMVLNGNKVQHRQIDTLPFLSSKDLSQSVLFTSSSDVKTATIDNLFTDYSLVWCQFVGSKTTHTHIIPLAYLKSKKSLVFKDGAVPFNILYVSDTQIRWFDVQASGAETYTCLLYTSMQNIRMHICRLPAGLWIMIRQ